MEPILKMQQFIYYLTISAVLICCLNFTVSASVFYVSTAGNDNSAGTEAQPFATIQKAVDVAQAGDTVNVLAGTYIPHNEAPDRGMIIFRNSGVPGKPITLTAQGEVIVTGNGGVSGFGAIFEINADQSNSTAIHDLTVRGFRLENSAWFGIHLNRAKNIILENNYTYNTAGSGIQASESSSLTIRGNTLENACLSPDKKMDTQEIISLSDVDGFEIEHNQIFNGGITDGGNGGEGIDTKTGSRNGTVHHNLIHDLVRLGIYVDAWDRTVENIQVYSNTVYNCAEGIAVSAENGGTVRKVEIFNNLLYNNRANGIIISNWIKNGLRQDIKIVNNTIFHNGFRTDKKPAWGGGISVETANIKNLVIRNNILSQNNLWQIVIGNQTAETTVDHNLIDGFRGYVDDKIREQKGENSFKGSPQFVDQQAGNFHLKPGSPAIDRGQNLLAPDKDFDLNPRPQGGSPDLGAFEIFKPSELSNKPE